LLYDTIPSGDDSMKIKTGYLYHIKDEFFNDINARGLMINHENGHSRPSYLAIKDKDILWFIPLSTKVKKYQKIIESKLKKYGTCKGILIKRIADKDSVILIQNAFPTLEKYIRSKHTIDGIGVRISDSVKREIVSDFRTLLSLKKNGLNLFFTDIDKIKKQLLDDKKDKVSI